MRANGDEGAVRDRPATITRIIRDRDLDLNRSRRGRYLRSPAEEEEDRGVQKDRKKRPAERG